MPNIVPIRCNNFDIPRCGEHVSSKRKKKKGKEREFHLEAPRDSTRNRKSSKKIPRGSGSCEDHLTNSNDSVLSAIKTFGDLSNRGTRCASVIIGRRGTKGVNEIRKRAGAIKMRVESFVMENYVKIIPGGMGREKTSFPASGEPITSRLNRARGAA